MKVLYIEIYKEELQDFLDLETSSKDLHVREDDKGNTGKTVRYSVKVSYIEIYKEEIQDLETPSKDLHIREDDKGNTGTGQILKVQILYSIKSLVVGTHQDWLTGAIQIVRG